MVQRRKVICDIIIVEGLNECFNMKKDLKTKLISRKIKKPNPLLMFLVMRLLGLLNKIYKVKFKYDYSPKDIKKGPTILLSSHASRLEFIYMIYGFKKNDQFALKLGIKKDSPVRLRAL